MAGSSFKRTETRRSQVTASSISEELSCITITDIMILSYELCMIAGNSAPLFLKQAKANSYSSI